MSVNFPTSPTTNEVYTNGSRSWTWTGVYWKATSTTVGYTGSKGESSYTYSDDPPPNPAVGDRWFNTTDCVELVWTNDGDAIQWVEIAASGFIGMTGYTGSSGAYAALGYTGSSGYSGSIGFTGSSGAATYRGFTGSRGGYDAVGFTGSIGFTGSSGEYAAVGFTGSVGYVGSQGIGNPGYVGSQGITGYTGSSGAYAAVGYVGSSGYTGSMGAVQGYDLFLAMMLLGGM